uniref:Uncharacterized protein n=1 Tax=Vespula pensylvanica TaxID=30213 RepID=A0A834P7R8_VESPE|nr:hypothetical protein H0235_004605 [Vespula pensylvanica]
MLSWRTACGICGYFDFVQDERGVTLRQTNLDPLVALALCRSTSAPLVVADTSHTAGLSVLKWSDVSYRETSGIKSFTEYRPFAWE